MNEAPRPGKIALDLPPDHAVRVIVQAAKLDALQANRAPDGGFPSLQEMPDTSKVPFADGLNHARQYDIRLKPKPEMLEYLRKGSHHTDPQ